MTSDKKGSYSCKGALSCKLTPYLNNSELADIQIKFGPQLFPAHRLVLGAWSDKLAKMMDEASGDILQLSSEATEKDIEVFERVLRFLYTGEVKFTADSVKMMMNLSDQLDLKQLGEMAQEWVGEMIDRGSMVSAVTWLREAVECNLPALKVRCLRTLALYFEYIPKAVWLGLSGEELLSIIEQGDIVADNEEAIIKRVDEWLDARGSPEDNQDIYEKIASNIRLPFLEASMLLSMQETSTLIKFATANCPLILSEAFKFRALASELTRKDGDDTNSACSLLKGFAVQPRLYLNFLPPGEQKYDSSYHTGRQSTKKDRFHEMGIGESSYNRSNLKCVVKKKNGAWKTGDASYWKFNMNLESKKSGNIEVWSAKYEIKPEDHRSRPMGDQRYKVVIVTRPLDKDSEFYLPDNPMVTTCEGSIKTPRPSHQTQVAPIVVCTPPIFAGKKPKKLEVAAIAYLVQDSTK